MSITVNIGTAAVLYTLHDTFDPLSLRGSKVKSVMKRHTELRYHSELRLLPLLVVCLPQLDGLVKRPRGERGAVGAPRDRENLAVPVVSII